MELIHFEVLSIDVTFNIKHVQKLVFNVIIQTKKVEYSRDKCLFGDPLHAPHTPI